MAGRPDRRSIAIAGTLLTLLIAASCSDGNGVGPKNHSEGLPRGQGTLTISPSEISLTAGDSAKVSVDLSGSTADVDPRETTWTVSPESAGIVRNQWFVALEAGTATITARYQGVEATSDVQIAPARLRLEPASATDVVGYVSQPLSDSVVVRVRRGTGGPAAGVPVRFTVRKGGGSVSPSRGITGADGRAAAVWTLGHGTGANVLEAVAEGMNPVSFHAEAVPDVGAASLEARAGQGQEGPVGEVLPTELQVEVRDDRGNPIPGVEVRWLFEDGSEAAGPSSTGPKVVEPTDGSGRSRVIWRLGTQAGTQVAHAELAVPGGQALRQTFHATATPGPVEDLRVEPAFATLGLGDAVEFRASPRDAHGNEVSGAEPTWLSTEPSVASADAEGRVTAVANGSARIRARIGSLIAFAAVKVVDEAPAALDATAGDGQSATVGTRLPEALTVRVMDGAGQPLPDVWVVWDAEDGSTPSSASTTDASGEASTRWTLGSRAGAQYLTASTGGRDVVFSATAVPGPIAAVQVTPTDVSLSRGSTASFSAEATDEFGNPLYDAAITWNSTDAAVVTVDAEGRATANGLGTAEIRASSGALVGAAAVRVHDGEPPADGAASWSATAGTSQTGTVGEALPVAPRVRIVNAQGDPVEGVSVTWKPGSGMGEASTPSTTGADGVASTQWTLGTRPGSQRLTASASGLNNLTFTAEAKPGAVAKVVVSPGSASIGKGESTSLTARAEDRYGNPRSASITWSSSDAGVASVSTDGTVTGTGPGTATISASAEGRTGQATVTVTASAAVVKRVTASKQSHKFNALHKTLQLRAAATDQDGRTMPGVELRWTSKNPSIASVDAMGMVTARAEGITSIIVAAVCCAAADTVTIEVDPSGDGSDPPSPYVFANFDDYVDIAAMDADTETWDDAERLPKPLGSNIPTARVELDDEIAYPGHSKSLKYTYNHGTDPWTTIYIARRLRFPEPQAEIWFEIPIRWSPNFTTAPGYAWEAGRAYSVDEVVIPTNVDAHYVFQATAAGTSSSTEPTWPSRAGATVTDGGVTWKAIATAWPVDHKLIFGIPTGDGRWQLKIGAGSAPAVPFRQGVMISTHGEAYPGAGVKAVDQYGLYNPYKRGLTKPYTMWENPKYDNKSFNANSTFWDGQWHMVRMHMKCSTTATSEDGALALWVDGEKIVEFGRLNTATRSNCAIKALALGRNKDDGPAVTDITINWGYVKVWNSDPGW